MAARSIGKKLQLEVTCFICMEYFIDPVTLDCGHNFCHACIVNHWEQFSLKPICPRCKQVVPWLNLKPNGQLANISSLVKQLSEQTNIPERVQVCKVCHKVQQSFCKDDLTLFCLECDLSMKHKAHNVVPVAEAAEEFKGLFLSCIEGLRKEKQQVLIYQSDMEKQCQELLVQIQAEKAQMMTHFQEMHELLREQNSFHLDRLEKVVDKIMAKKNDHMAGVTQELSAIEDITRKLEEKCQQPELAFLQDAGSTLERCRKKKKFLNPVVFPPAIKGEIWGLRDFNTFLQNAMEEFEESSTSDPNTAYPKRLRLADVPEDLEES
ncbi:Zinc finger protein RFP [Varanus komodoensis]|nr:Zinc finger protein RFP [Varanus komodoensis]